MSLVVQILREPESVAADHSVALLLSVLSTALWLLGSDAPTATQVDQAESMLHFFGKHVSEWFGA